MLVGLGQANDLSELRVAWCERTNSRLAFRHAARKYGEDLPAKLNRAEFNRLRGMRHPVNECCGIMLRRARCVYTRDIS